MTVYWSRILYYNPAGRLDHLYLREHSPDGRMIRTYYNSDPEVTQPGTLITMLDTSWYDADGNLEYSRTRTSIPWNGMVEVFVHRVFRSAGKIDSTEDSLYTGHSEMYPRAAISCGRRESPDGTADTALCTYVSRSVGIFRYRDGTYRDSAYKYRNGALRAAGRYDYRKVDIDSEVRRLIGDGYIP